MNPRDVNDETAAAVDGPEAQGGAGETLLAAAGELRDSFAATPSISTSRLVNPLLDLWAMAASLGPEVTKPIEELITVYNGPRELAVPSELDELLERLQSGLRGAMV